jgi:hypothetical protein
MSWCIPEPPSVAQTCGSGTVQNDHIAVPFTDRLPATGNPGIGRIEVGMATKMLSVARDCNDANVADLCECIFSTWAYARRDNDRQSGRLAK